MGLLRHEYAPIGYEGLPVGSSGYTAPWCTDIHHAQAVAIQKTKGGETFPQTIRCENGDLE